MVPITQEDQLQGLVLAREVELGVGPQEVEALEVEALEMAREVEMALEAEALEMELRVEVWEVEAREEAQ